MASDVGGDASDLIKMSGYLMKKSTAGDWQKRYFETNGSFLTYYKSQKMSKLLAALSLPQVGDIRSISTETGDPFTFQLDLKDRQYILKAMSAQEAENWVRTLVNLRDGAGSPSSAAKKQPTTSSATTPSRSDFDPSSDSFSPKTQATEPHNNGAWVKDDGPGIDQCTAGCSIA